MVTAQPARRVAQTHIRLGQDLRRYRRRSGLGGVEAARRAGMSQSKISRLENCRLLPSLTDLRTLCDVYNVTGGERDELIELATAVREESKRSRIVLPRAAAQLQASFAQMAAKASLLRNFCPTIVPGILQTPAYVRTIFEDELSGDDLDRVVAARTARRTAAFGDRSKQIVVIVSEGALRWQLGSAALMAEQIDAVVEATRVPNVQLGIIPWTRPVRTVCTHSFNIYDASAVVVGTEVSSATFTEPDDVQLYLDLFGRLEEVASFGEDARRELARIGNDYRLLA